MSSAAGSNFASWSRHAPVWLVVAVLALLPVGRAAEAPLGVAAICALALIWQRRDSVRTNAGLRLAALLFGCYWLPALISVIDSVAPGKSWSTVRDLLRFLPFCAFVCLALRDGAIFPRVVNACAAIVALWAADAWVQALTGHGIAGISDPDRLSGVFGAENLKLGPALAVLSPFVLVAARQCFGLRGFVLAFVFLLPPILLAGERAAWLMFSLAACALLWREARTPLRFAAWGAGFAAFALIAALAALHFSPAFQMRVDRSLLALQGSERSLDEAGAGRVRIWRTAARMIAAHPLDGVGVRAFRYAYPRYAGAHDDFVAPDGEEGALHAHQIVLEVLSETGAIGLAFWLAGALAAWRAWRRANAPARERALAPALALAVMTFPLDTHLAFYSAWWGLLFWWLLALYCAALNAEESSC